MRLKLKNELYHIIAEHSGQDFDKVWKDSDRDYWILEEAKSYGMIDEVLEKNNGRRKSFCSFCSRNKQDTNILIAGNSAHICDACITQANNIVQQDLLSASKISNDFNLLKQEKIKDYLDDYIIGQDEVKKVISVGIQSLQTFNAT